MIEKRKVAKRGGNVAKAPANKTPKRVPTPRGQDRDYWGKKGKTTSSNVYA